VERSVFIDATCKRKEVTDKNLIVNNSFEEPALKGGLDWRYYSSASVLASVDPLVARVETESSREIYSSPEFSRTTEWRQFKGEFTADANTTLLTVKIVRQPGTKIKGERWIPASGALSELLLPAGIEI
jgi:hypothetical protein